MKTSLSLRSEWESYRRQVIPADAPMIQLVEMRRAFYAGSAAAFGILCQISRGDLSEAEEGARLDSLGCELEAFGQALKDGKA
ncbi:hypothetical protein [Singulisphaera sp. PoT]|uniref:hypothetical protein n=1 Tax=Singulisphaera sp. PoT TaxID=3411797 RepID=UPI003BF5BF57